MNGGCTFLVCEDENRRHSMPRHLTWYERYQIERALPQGLSQVVIARRLGRAALGR